MLEDIMQEERSLIKETDKLAKSQGFYFFNVYFMPNLAKSIETYGTDCPLSEHYARAYESALNRYKSVWGR